MVGAARAGGDASASPASRAGRRWRSARRRASSSACAATNSRRPSEPRSSLVSSTSFRLKPSLPPRSASTCLQRGQVQRVLALVVGAAAAVPAIAFLGQRPGIEARRPTDPPARARYRRGHRSGRSAAPDPHAAPRSGSARSRSRGLAWIATEKPRRSSHGRIALEVTLHVRLVRRVLRGAGDRDQFRQPVTEAVAVEELHRPCYRAVTRTHPAAFPGACRRGESACHPLQ